MGVLCSGIVVSVSAWIGGCSGGSGGSGSGMNAGEAGDAPREGRTPVFALRVLDRGKS